MSDAEFNEGAAVVIGGSGGVGSAICKRLALRGSSVALTYRRNETAAREVVSQIERIGGTATAHQVDLTDVDAVQQTVDTIVERHSAVHGLVHAAGTHIDQPYVSQLKPAEWKRVVDADVHGFFNVVHAALPLLRKSSGSLVFISSAGLRRFPPGDVLSVAPKGAIEALVRAIAKEEGRHGVRANNVALGVIDAGMFPKLVQNGELSQAWIDAATKNTPLRRFGSPEEVADAVVYLVSNRSSYITGQSLMLDGGYTV